MKMIRSTLSLLLMGMLANTAFANQSEFKANQCLKMLDQRSNDEMIILSNCDLSDKHMDKLNHYLKKHPVRYLMLDGNQITSAGAINIVKNNKIDFVDFSQNLIANEGAVALAKTLKTYASVRAMDVSGNRILDKGLVALSKVDSLTSLGIGEEGNGFKKETINALANNYHLETLFVKHDYVSDEEWLMFANSRTLKYLALQQVPIFDRNQIAEAFAANNVLEWLGIIDCKLGTEATIKLAKNTHLLGLSLLTNNIGPEGAIALSKNNTLYNLSIDNNEIGSTGAMAFVNNTTLTVLTMGNNDIGDDAVVNLAKNTTLSLLFLGENNIHDAGALALADNATLEVLAVEFNKIEKAGIQALRNSKTLKILFSIGNPGDEDKNAAKASAKPNLFLKSYCISQHDANCAKMLKIDYVN